MEEVRDLIISEGITYSGAAEFDGNKYVPNGVGMMKYANHNESGVFQNGKLNGVAYLNYHDWMNVGVCSNGKINGWGLKVDRGEISFGVYQNSVLKVNLTPLVEVFWNKILEDATQIGRNAISVIKTGEVFVGVPPLITQGKFGFHFLNNGEVFLGICKDGELGRTGYFLHFDLEYNITKGEYKDGVLVREIDDDDFLSQCCVFINHAYNDFNISMNYHPDTFYFKDKKLLSIIEMGKTATNIIIKANICRIIGDNISVSNIESDSTLWFAFPQDPDIEEELISLSNNQDRPWAPNFSDYRVDFVNNLSHTNSHLIVYTHESCWNKDADYDVDIFYELSASDFGIESKTSRVSLLEELIPYCYQKKSQLQDQWVSRQWYFTYPSVRDYVISLATGDDVDNFFGWLFDDYSLNGSSLWDLSNRHRQAFEQFLGLFSE